MFISEIGEDKPDLVKHVQSFVADHAQPCTALVAAKVTSCGSVLPGSRERQCHIWFQQRHFFSRLCTAPVRSSSLLLEAVFKGAMERTHDFDNDIRFLALRISRVRNHTLEKKKHRTRSMRRGLWKGQKRVARSLRAQQEVGPRLW